jgi:hypothetical protein
VPPDPQERRVPDFACELYRESVAASGGASYLTREQHVDLAHWAAFEARR